MINSHCFFAVQLVVSCILAVVAAAPGVIVGHAPIVHAPLAVAHAVHPVAVSSSHTLVPIYDTKCEWKATKNNEKRFHFNLIFSHFNQTGALCIRLQLPNTYHPSMLSAPCQPCMPSMPYMPQLCMPSTLQLCTQFTHQSSSIKCVHFDIKKTEN